MQHHNLEDFNLNQTDIVKKKKSNVSSLLASHSCEFVQMICNEVSVVGISTLVFALWPEFNLPKVLCGIMCSHNVKIHMSG
jgi:hypothetical protein